MAKGGQKVYMPVVIGDWLKGTRGMRADVRGVYMGLLLHQWEKGFIPEDIYELEEIEREVNKVWDKLKDKFIQIEPGKLQNEKLEEVREFWQKQKKNGKKGGRPKNENPKHNPEVNPTTNPNNNLHNALDIDSDSGFNYQLKEQEKKVDTIEVAIEVLQPETFRDDLVAVYDDITRETLMMTYRDVDIDDQWIKFQAKVRGSPGKYQHHDTEGLRLAFNYHLQKAPKRHGSPKTKQQRNTNELIEGFAARRGNGKGPTG